MTATRLNNTSETINGWSVTNLQDGTVEVRKRVTKSNLSFSSWGSSYYYCYVTDQMDYPFAFSDYPSVTVGLVNLVGADIAGVGFVNNTFSKSKSPRVMLTRPTSISGAYATVEVAARGVRA